MQLFLRRGCTISEGIRNPEGGGVSYEDVQTTMQSRTDVECRALPLESWRAGERCRAVELYIHRVTNCVRCRAM